MKTIDLTKDEFTSRVADYKVNGNQWEYLGDKPAVIDFYADWCGPCKALSPVLDELAKEYADRIYIYKVNIDKEPELCKMFRIQSVPTLLFAPIIGTPQMSSGVMTKQQLTEAIEHILAAK